MKTRTTYYVDYRRFAERSYQQLQMTTIPEFNKALGLAEQNNGSTEAGLVERVYSLLLTMSEQATTTVVFAAMAAEGFIFDYAAERLSASYVKTYLDKLDIVSKWVVVPKLVTGHGLATGGQGMNLLRQLAKRRNALVHYKSREIDVTHEVDPVQFALVEQAKEALQALDALAAEIEAIDPDCRAADRIGRNAEARWQLDTGVL